MLKITNFGAACCVIEGGGVRILCDPWLIGTAYMGAWEREDYLPGPVAAIGKVDCIWISRLHEDHLHVESLRFYLSVYPVPILIGPHCRHMPRMLKEAGLAFRCGDLWVPGGIDVHILRNPDPRSEGIDSVLIVTDDESAVVNLNDNPFNEDLAASIRGIVGSDRITTALIPYTGAGPWPQCFTMSDDEMRAAAKEKADLYVQQFKRWAVALKSHIHVPFSAGYRLRGPLGRLNHHRGIVSPGSIYGATPLPVVGAARRPETTFTGYDWERDPMPEQAEFVHLFETSAFLAPRLEGTPLSVRLVADGILSCTIQITKEEAEGPHETIHVDARLLGGLLTRKYHWNTAEVGSCLRYERQPGRSYDPRVMQFLYRFHI